MTNRIDYTDFVNYLNIPNTNKETVLSFLDSEITRLQNKFFVELFGYEFQSIMFLTPLEPEFEAILDGKEFTDLSGSLQLWDGINSALAKYVYFYFIKDNPTLTGIGYVSGNSENSTKVQAIDKPVTVFNDMVDELSILESYLRANEDLYEDDNLNFTNFTKVNSFGI